MSEFLAETYALRDVPIAQCVGEAALAAEEASQHRAPVRLLGAIAVPGEETCFWLYQAPSAGAVGAAMTRAGLRPERVTPAVPITPPKACPARASTKSTDRPGRQVSRNLIPAAAPHPGQRRAPARVVTFQSAPHIQTVGQAPAPNSTL